jgi:thymidylate synthase
MKNNIEHQYLKLVKDILENGVEKQDRTGTGTLSVFGRQIRHDMKLGFPLLTTKKMYWKGIATELLWFLRGDTNIKYLVDNNCHIWDGDAYKNYIFNSEWFPISSVSGGFIGTKANSDEIMTQELFINKIKTDDEFAKKWGELGPIYGKQWRNWGRKNVTNYDLKDVKGSDQHKVIKAIKNGEDVTKYGVKIEYQNNSIDQIANLINELKTNPDSRRLMVSAWNVGELDQMVLPPCHNFWQMYSVKKEGKRYLSMMVNIRSNDVPLGLPFNIASYGLLLEIISRLVNMIPDELIINIGDAHIYLNQIEGIKEQLTRESYPLPKLIFNNQIHFSDNIDEFLNSCLITDFTIENYQSHPSIKLPLSN